MKKKQIRIRCWVEIDETRFFGPGPAELLERILEEGSLSRAARRMNMSYKKAWDIVENLNTHSQTKFVLSHKGGVAGGSTEVTAHGKKVLASYRKLTAKLNRVLASNHQLLKTI